MGIHANLNIFDYDNAGNLLKDDKSSYTYDGFNRTTKVETFDGNIQINRYDAEGLRYEMEENNNLVQFIFNQNREVIAEQETTWTSYIRGSTLLASSADHARTYYHFASDEMSSVTHIVDDEKVLNEYEYDAWGEVVKSVETVKNRFKFNGQQLDPITQQYYLRARFYNPVIARFTQEDTYRGDGLNLYAYCGNNPVYYVEPTGNESQSKSAPYPDNDFQTEINKNYQDELAFNKDRNLTTFYDADKAKAQNNDNTKQNQPERPRADEPSAQSSLQYQKLQEYYRQAEKYGVAAIKELQNGRYRFYGEVIPAKTKGVMEGRRLVREWDPHTGNTRTWHETLDHNGIVRQVRPSENITDGKKVHYTFDEQGNYTDKW